MRLVLNVSLLHVIVIVHEILIDARRRVGWIMRDALVIEVVQSPFEIGVFPDKIVIALLIHFVAMVVNPQIPIALPSIHQP